MEPGKPSSTWRLSSREGTGKDLAGHCQLKETKRNECEGGGKTKEEEDDDNCNSVSSLLADQQVIY